MHLSRQNILDGFADLGTSARAAGKIIDLAVYGGSCLMLVSNFRDASQDVDAVASTDQVFIDRIASEIAVRRGWPLDWLSDGVRVYLSPNVEPPDEHTLFGTYPSEREPGLRVYVPTPEYLLAMKLMALRIDASEGEKDKADIENLIRILGIGNKQALIDLAARYYPEAKVSAKLILAAGEIIRSAAGKKELDHVAPQFLDRRGS
jgi:hypothetical protein